MNLPKMIRSFRYAGAGLLKLLRAENNFQFHTLAAVLVILAGSFAGLERWEWMTVTACIAAVFAAEAFNTAIEKLCDLVTTEHLKAIEDIKDIAAAGVLLTAAGSLVVAFFIFGKRLFDLLL